MRTKGGESIIGTSSGVIKAKDNGSRHAERGEDEHAAAQEREKCDTFPTVAALDPTVRIMYKNQTAHQRICKEYTSYYRKLATETL